MFYAKDTRHVAGPLTGDYFAIGSGSEYAMGAMEFGASAVEAVRVGCKLDVWSGFPIYAVRSESDGPWKIDQ